MIWKVLDRAEEYFVVATMGGMTALVFAQVVMRYVFQDSLSWSEEMARYIFLWLSWIGASYAVRKRTHFRVTMFADRLSGRARAWYEIFVLLIWCAFSIFMVIVGTQIVLFLQGSGQVSAALEVPIYWVYASVPVGCALMALRVVVEIVKIINHGMPQGTGEVR